MADKPIRGLFWEGSMRAAIVSFLGLLAFYTFGRKEGWTDAEFLSYGLNVCIQLVVFGFLVIVPAWKVLGKHMALAYVAGFYILLTLLLVGMLVSAVFSGWQGPLFVFVTSLIVAPQLCSLNIYIGRRVREHALRFIAGIIVCMTAASIGLAVAVSDFYRLAPDNGAWAAVVTASFVVVIFLAIVWGVDALLVDRAKVRADTLNKAIEEGRPIKNLSMTI